MRNNHFPITQQPWGKKNMADSKEKNSATTDKPFLKKTSTVISYNN
jgi:hypothetical protein